VFVCVQSNEDEYDCDCNGVDVATSATTCTSALDTACQLLDAVSCERTWLGACREADAADSWACLCAHSPHQLQVTAGNSCANTLLDACGVSCDAEYGSCEPRLGPLSMFGMPSVGGGVVYDCDCEAYGERTLVEDGSGCHSTLQRGCDTEFRIEGTGPCNGPSGYCSFNDTDGRWWCTCSDGITLAFDPNTLLGDGADDSCATVTSVACGPSDSLDDCSRETNGGTAACTRTLGSFTTFACTCDSTCTDQIAEEVIAASCDTAMDATCGVDGPLCD
jgi:hypothetical protein